MADQLNMGSLSLSEQQQQSTARSYIPPHMRGKMGGGGNNAIVPGPGPVPGPVPGPGPGPVPGPSPAAMNGLNNSAWAG